ncbi:hypothetical protein KAI65_01085 [Candidatus Parcubacteria bacterium]|nr:hypothetical protein [Candidatus Parcubacteria bacterium]
MPNSTSKYKDITGVVTNVACRVHSDHGKISSEMVLKIDSMPYISFRVKMPYRIDVGEVVKIYHVYIANLKTKKSHTKKYEASMIENALGILRGGVEVFRINFSENWECTAGGATGWGDHD